MRIIMLMSVIRSSGPVMVGISLGFTLSFLSVTWVDETCDADLLDSSEMFVLPTGGSRGARKPSSISSDNNIAELFEPRIVPYVKTAEQGSAKKVVRAKYASTELGIRERLFVSVFTSKSTLNTLAVAINRTLSHHLDGRLIFFSDAGNHKTPNGMFVVEHEHDHPVPNMFQSVRYLLEHHIDEYDWFYQVQDDMYIQPDRLKNLVNHLSMNLQLYMGHPGEFIGDETSGKYCHSGSGFLMSRALLLKLQPFLEQCRADIISVRPDEWLGRCIIDYAGVHCVEEYEGLKYQHYQMANNIAIERMEEDVLQKALAVHPVTSATLFYHLHKLFTEAELLKTSEEIKKLQSEIKKTSDDAMDGNQSVTWPIGIPAPFQPKSRFELLRWDYFSEEHLFTCVDGAPKCYLKGADREDVTDVIKVAAEELNKRYNPAVRLGSPRLVNGYRRFDHSRGMEYMMELQFQATTVLGSYKPITRRVHLVRPLSQVEILPMPYVTEATRVHVLVPLTSYESLVALRFLEHSSNLFERRENVLLSFLFIYEPAEAQKVSMNDVFREVKAKIADTERRFINVKVSWISIRTESSSVLRILDIVSRKHPVDTLFLLVTADTELNSEFLNRCRMNTISGWQTFFPIHFQEFDPCVANPKQTPRAPSDLLSDAGHFDRHSFGEVCFYNSDYITSRTRMAADMQDNEELLENVGLYDLFVQNTGLHVFRAVEPALRQAYRNRTCNPRLSEEMFHRCLQSNLEGLGSRSQLAMLIFEQDHDNGS